MREDVMQRTNHLLARDLLKFRVCDPTGEDLGRIEELVLDSVTGRITFAVLSLRGITGTDDTLYGVPWDNLSYTSKQNYLRLDVDKKLLRNAPVFERTIWPDMDDPRWGEQIYAHYGRPATRPSIEPIEVRRGSRSVSKDTSPAAAVALILLLVVVLGLGFMVWTHGWDRTRSEITRSVQGVTHAVKETSADAALTAKVKTALSLNERVPAGEINVDSDDGVVTMRGEVASAEVRDLATQIAENTPGVREVRNHLFVVSPSVK
jgi:hypothetical protein